MGQAHHSRPGWRSVIRDFIRWSDNLLAEAEAPVPFQKSALSTEPSAFPFPRSGNGETMTCISKPVFKVTVFLERSSPATGKNTPGWVTGHHPFDGKNNQNGELLSSCSTELISRDGMHLAKTSGGLNPVCSEARNQVPTL